MRYRITPKRVLFGVALCLLFGFMTYGHVALGQWSFIRGALFGLVACGVALGLAFTAKVDSTSSSGGTVVADDDTPGRRFRNNIALWVVTVLLLLVLFSLLGAFHIKWRQYVP
jgi:hypothetical protein